MEHHELRTRRPTKGLSSKTLAVLCGVAFMIACGVLGRREEIRASESDPPVATVQAAVSAVAASGVSTDSALPVPVADYPLDRVCVHHKSDGACLLPTPNDQDADGFSAGVDCNDHDPYVYPGAPEAKCDGVDDDCDGKDFCPVDQDADGFSPPADCDDHDPNRNPSKPEIWCNGIDEDCDGKDDCDQDGDSIPESQDCNDHDPSISPVTPEILCDGIDQNCDGTDCCQNDEDGDRVPCASDCDDRDPNIYPGAPIPPGCYWKDVNCDGTLDGICRL